MIDILIIINPASGKYKIVKPLLKRIIAILKEKADNVEYILTEYKGHATEIAKNSSSRIIIAAGGDGLINEVASGMVNTDKLFYALPFGTKNVFCKEYGISANPIKAATCLDIKNIKKIPVGYVDNYIFLLMVGVGFDAQVVKNVETKGVRFKLLKTLAHIVQSIPAIFTNKYSKMDMYVNGRKYELYHGICAIATYYAGSYKLGKITKDKINVFFTEKKGLLHLLKSFIPLFLWFGFKGTIINSEHVKINGASFCQRDGEYTKLKHDSIYIYIKKQAINFIVPLKKI